MKKASFPSHMLLICLVMFLINIFNLQAQNNFYGWNMSTVRPGATDGISCGALGFTEKDITVELWLYISTSNFNSGVTIASNRHDGIKGFSLDVSSDGRLRGFFRNDNGEKLNGRNDYVFPFFFEKADVVDKWVHIAIVFSSTNNIARSYLNGNVYQDLVKTTDPYVPYEIGWIGNHTSEMRLGYWYAANPKFYGKIADFRIWSIGRTDAEIKANYNKNLEGTYENNPGLYLNYRFNTYERGFINNANPTVATNKGWCNPSTNWNTYYTRETLSSYPENVSLSNGLLQWNTSAGAWEVAVFKADDNTNVFTDTIATDSISLRDIAELGVGLSYYTKVRTQNNGFYSNWVTTGNFSIDRYYRFSGNGAWNNPANWEKSYDNVNWIGADVVPSSASATTITIQNGQSVVVNNDMTANSVTVKAGGNLTLNEAANVNISSLTLESNSGATATLLDNYSTPTIRATVQQYVDAGRNWYVSSPVSVASYTVLDKGTSVVEFNEVTKNWDPVASGNLTPGKGYIQVASASQPGSSGTIVFADKLTNSGDITVQLTRTESGSSRGFNLVGNPYPSYLDWSKVAAANPNVLPTAWFRTKKTVEAGGGYTFATVNVKNETPIIVNGDANTAITNYIPPMQAYWVRLVENPVSNNFTVTNAMRDYPDNTENKLKSPRQNNIKMIRLQVSNGNSTDETVLYSTSAASDSYDRYDSPKMSNNSSTVPEIFTQIGSEKLVINGMNEIKYDTEIPLGFTTGEQSSFTIKASQMSNFEPNVKMLLKDKFLNLIYDLTNGDSYSFDSDVATTDSRFCIIFKSVSVATDVNETNIPNVSVYANSLRQIMLNFATLPSSNLSISVYNCLGSRVLYRKDVSKDQLLNEVFVPGTYVVNISNGEATVTKKVIIY